MKQLRRLSFLLMFLFLGTSSVAWAQVDDEIFSAVQFNFSSPGARSLGLGGAFIGLANDATAAVTNPAGLTVLESQQVAVEGRSFDFSSRYVSRGHNLGPRDADR